MAAIADQDFLVPGYGILLHPGLQRLDRTKKSFQEKGDRYGKDNQGENRRVFGSYLGRKRVGLLHKWPENLPAPLTREEEAQVFQRLPGGCRGTGNADRP